MPGRPAIDRPVPLHTSLRTSVRAILEVNLFSSVEGRVPKGAYQEFFEARIQEHFSWGTLDLTPFGYPPGSFVRGPKEVLEQLSLSLRTPE